jgi:anaerobic magnesium-protoporphyrin IX monomethyl ester cyclase
MSRILLAQPSFNAGKRLPETPSRALLILGTLAKLYGHEVKIAHLDIDEIDWSWNPEIVGITVNTFQVKSARNVSRTAMNRNARVIIGGPHAIAWDMAKDGKVHKVAIGEGENDWLEFIGAKPNINSIDDLPPVDYSLVDMDRFTGVEPIGAVPSMAIMASRGCPGNCTFCNTPVFWGKSVRYTKPQTVLDEISLLHEKYGINEIFFQDDTFNFNHKWAFEIFQGIIDQGLSNEMMFKLACRVNEKLLTTEFLDMAKKAGVWDIFYGIESGSQYMLDRMKKGITIPEIARAVKLTKERGISAHCSFIVGMPGENMKTLAETDALIREIQPSLYGWCYACPFPGTELDKEVTEKGFKWQEDYDKYCFGNVYCRTDALDFNEIQAFKGFSL